MKKQILQALKDAKDGFVSGQSLCEQTGVTRQAVWKNMSQLKEAGFEIESVSNKGYRLKKIPDILYGADIESRIGDNCLCKKVESFASIDSTNVYARKIAEEGEPEGTLIVADEQTAGKGRRGRSWSSELGTGIFMSLILRPSVNPLKISGITIIAALAIAKAIHTVCDVMPEIKWPNDIVLGKKKICGILTEMSLEMNCIHYAIVGIGINANNTEFPEDIKDKASSIYLQTDKKADRAQIVAESMKYFSSYYEKFIECENLEPFIEEYNSILANKDNEVQILYGMEEDVDKEKIDTGIAKGIDKDGALIVETKKGLQKVVSGEVSVRGLYGYV